MKNNQPKYSKTEFDGFTHRFIVRFSVDEDWRSDMNLDVYSNSGSYEDIGWFIDKNNSSKVKSYEIVHRATKEQDELCSKLIEESLLNL